jgi:TonB family protein
MKRAAGVLLLLAADLSAAAPVSGPWTGTMTAPRGAPVPVFLILHEQGQEISGSIVFTTESSQVPIEKVELRGDRLFFRAPDSLNHVVAFQLTVTVRSMNGEAISQGQTFKVILSPATRPDAYRDGPSASAPTLIYKTDPEYTEEARQAKLQGTVLVYVQISPEGIATNIRVLRGIGMGLDEKAMDAVARWRFKPGMKDGRPVTVEAQIEVNFRL